MEKILITGGQTSGKSTLAVRMADAIEGKRIFIATAIAFDQELKDKIQAHKNERGNRYHTIEEPLYLHQALIKADGFDPEVIVIDCMTIWVSNLMFQLAEDVMEKEMALFFDTLEQMDKSSRTKQLICVTNETGWGIIPADPISRKYVKHLGNLNKRIAAAFNSVFLSCCGLEIRLK